MFRLWLPKLPPLTASRTRIFIHRLSQTQDTIIPQHDPLRSNIFPNMDCSGTKTSFKAPIPPCSKMTSASHKTQRPQQRGCRALCCSCRVSVSSSDDAAESPNSDRFASISTLAHAMVQERLEQMIKESQEARHRERRRRPRSEGNITAKFIVMVALEKSSYDPRQDFRESMIEMIMANKIQEPKDLRGLLNYYVSMNSEEYHAIILEVFYEVCSNMFLRCKWH